MKRVVFDAFGDFRFDRLAPGSGRHELSITHPIHGGSRLSLDLAQSSVVLGEVRPDSR